MPNPKELEFAHDVELDFWQDVFRTALGNPQLTDHLIKVCKETNTLLSAQLAMFADQSIKQLRQRTLEHEAVVHFLGAPK